MASLPPPSVHQNEPVEPNRPGGDDRDAAVRWGHGVDDVWVAGADRARAAVPHEPRPGELTKGWYVVFGLAWLAVAVALAAVWSASRQIGLSTWWLGPPARPRPIVVNIAPFVVPLLLVAGSLNRARYLPWFGLVGAAVTAAIGVGDLFRVRGFGVVELIVAAAAAGVSAASLAGMYRSAR